jgi:hypothetical protein
VFAVHEDEYYEVDYEAIDIDGPTTFQWYLETSAKWLAIDNGTGVLNGTPSNDDVGSHYVNVTVVDERNGSTSSNFTLGVINVNDLPVWKDIPVDMELMEGEWFIFDVNATDVDAYDVLIYELTADPDINITIDPSTGLIKWRASIIDLAGPDYFLSITLKATDGIYPIFTSFNISVLENIRPNVFLLLPSDGSIASHSNTVFEWEGYDEFNDPLTYDVYLHQKESFVSLLREDALFLKGTDLEEISTDGLEIGATYYWTVKPHDGLNYGECLDGIFSFIVNTPPVIVPIDDQVVSAGDSLVLDLKGTDIDMGDYERFQFNLGSAPRGLLMDDSRDIITWTPTKFQLGIHEVQIILTDGRDSSNITFEIEVVEAIQESESELGNALYMTSMVAIIVIVIIFVILMMIVRKRKRQFRSELGVSESDKKLGGLPRFLVGKPGMLSGPTITAAAQQPQIQAAPTAQPAQPSASAVPTPAPTIPPPVSVPPKQLPPAPFEPQAPVPTPAPTPAAVPVAAPATEVVQDDVVPDFGLEGGPTQVQKDAVVHDVAFEQVQEEPDLSAVIEDLKAAGVIKPTDEGTVVHEVDAGIWRPDVRGKTAESKEVLEQIEKLTELKEKGALTEEEFERRKQELLN